MQRVLVIEDELSIQRLISYDLTQAQFEVDVASDGLEGYKKAVEGNFDLIILDLMLPNLSGTEVCKKLRENSVNSFIIVLTAKDSEVDKLDCFNLGADDYVTKPFSPRELVARVKAILRRKSIDNNNLTTNIEIGNIVVDTHKMEVFVNGNLITLTLKEYDLLHTLIKNKNKVLSRDFLLTKLWGYEYDGDTRVVDVHIFKIRDKIKGSRLKIKTIRGIGYMLEVESNE